MCIFLATTEHEEFPFILLDNRDEYLDRPTTPAHWWDTNPNVYAPQDLQREAKGTWIGATRTGKIAVLVNYFQEGANISMKLSRGALPKQYLESDMAPQEWVQFIKNKHKDELDECGGFTLLAVQLHRSDETNDIKVDIAYLTNEKVELPGFSCKRTISLSNGPMDDPSWLKTKQALQLAKPLFKATKLTDLVKESLNLLSTKSEAALKTQRDLRNHIFVPEMLGKGDIPYGTRTQTVIAMDRQGNVHYIERCVQTQEMRSEVFQLKS